MIACTKVRVLVVVEVIGGVCCSCCNVMFSRYVVLLEPVLAMICSMTNFETDLAPRARRAATVVAAVMIVGVATSCVIAQSWVVASIASIVVAGSTASSAVAATPAATTTAPVCHIGR